MTSTTTTAQHATYAGGPSLGLPNSERSLSEVVFPHCQKACLFDMVQRGCTNEHRVIIIATHKTMVRNPTQCNLCGGQLMFLGNGTKNSQRLEIGFVPVPSPDGVSEFSNEGKYIISNVPVSVILGGRYQSYPNAMKKAPLSLTFPWDLVGSNRDPASGCSSLELYRPVKNPPPTEKREIMKGKDRKPAYKD